MTRVLVVKLLRDLRWYLLIVALLLLAFQCLWAKITERITGQFVPLFATQMNLDSLKNLLFQGPGKLLQTLMGGETIDIQRAMDILSIGYVHPLMQTIFCIWAIGRAASAIAGEIDRGTMELLLAQPLARPRVILAHLCVDLITIPILCLSLYAGTWLGQWLVGPIKVNPDMLHDMMPNMPFFVRPSGPIDPKLLQIDVAAFAPALWNVAALLLAISGYTMWLSARGRFRGRVLGAAVLVTLLQFLINVCGQLWEGINFLRPLTVFYYFQPQQIILKGAWNVDLEPAWGWPVQVNVLAVLFSVAAAGYLLALWTFCRRDLPAPL
ncbi:MAG: ABC transporter permease subunit [Gemmataceae bacterium]